ncbi:MAG: hypothetical protein BWY70_00613 [Bacteroidetes bacterium ADurb.Bin408]|nr:MAG: hypothetical protein BWY70_00613 [Bacteroidetes bacterium ADurb.Bin408]
MHKYFIIGIIFLLCYSLQAQTIYPKREVRAVWVATVSNVDYPSSSGLTTTAQKNEFIDMLDKFKLAGINTIFMQVRPSCDAFYNNPNEPWSQWLTGTQGVAPSPLYDPLDFYVNEAHKRGFEIHAWLNPYRSVVNIYSSSIAYNHVSVLYPAWNVTYNTTKILNPGLQAVREYVTSVLMYIVNNYDVDGIHFDDYFYPYPQTGYVFNDANAFANDPRGFTNIDDWRRDNVNMLIGMVNDSIKAAKKYVKFGVSPFGIWKSGTPPGITGLSSYYEIYCDPVNWLNNEKIDYVLPQLYWQLGGSQDFNALSNWWGNQAQSNGRHCYAGIATYRMSSSNWSVSEIKNQINTVRNINSKVQGYSFFSATQLNNNVKGINDTLKNNQQKYRCLIPTMPWLDSIPPNPPVNVAASVATDHVNITWQLPAPAADGDSARYFVIYRFQDSASVNLNNATAIIAVTARDTTAYYDPYAIPAGSSAIYVVTACDRLHNESTPVWLNACNACITATNNECEDALQLISHTTCQYTLGTLNGATAGQLPKASCDAFGSPALKDVFYYFIAEDSEHTIEVNPTGVGSEAVDAVLAVYSGNNCSALAEISCTGGSGGSGGVTKTLTLNGLTPGQQYWLRIYDYGTLDPLYTEFEICITHNVSSHISSNITDMGAVLYPNPAKQFLNINMGQKIQTVIIRNSMGQVVFNRTIDEIPAQMDISDIKPGFYFIEILLNDFTIIQKLIKQ